MKKTVLLGLIWIGLFQCVSLRIDAQVIGGFKGFTVPKIRLAEGLGNQQFSKKSKKALAKITDVTGWSTSSIPTNDTVNMTELVYDASHKLTSANVYFFNTTTHERILETRTVYSDFVSVKLSNNDFLGSSQELYYGLMDSFENITYSGNESRGSVNLYDYSPKKVTKQYLVSGRWVDSLELDIFYNSNNQYDSFVSKGYVSGVWKSGEFGKVIYDKNNKVVGQYQVGLNQINGSIAGYIQKGVEAFKVRQVKDAGQKVIQSYLDYYYNSSGTSYNVSNLKPIYKENYYYTGKVITSASKFVTDSPTWRSNLYFGFYPIYHDSISSIVYQNFSQQISTNPYLGLLFGGNNINSKIYWKFDNTLNKYVQESKLNIVYNNGNYFTQNIQKFDVGSSSFILDNRKQIYTNTDGSFDHNIITYFNSDGKKSKEDVNFWNLNKDSDGDLLSVVRTDSVPDIDGFGTYNIYQKTIYDYNSFLTGINDLNNTTFGKIAIFPNPANEILFIKGVENQYKIEVINIVGKVVYSMVNQNQETISIDINHLERGVYLLRVNQGNQINQLKFVKQ